MIKKIIQFITVDIWKLRPENLARIPAYGVKLLRIMITAIRGFNEDKCLIRAAALTFYSVLSLVPVLAMLFAVAKGFGLEKRLEDRLRLDTSYNQEVLEKVFEFANAMLETTRGGLLAGVGVFLLFYAVMKVLGNIERAFNDIWEVRKSRSMMRKVTDYLSIMLIAPALVILSGSATIYIKANVERITESMEIIGFFGPVIFFLLRLLPFFSLWMLLSIMYMVMPNTKVKFTSALLAGVIAGTIVQAAELLYFSFQYGVSNYNAIYGGFAALPLFLIWMNINWIFVLFGAEVSFAAQNHSKYEFEQESGNISHRLTQRIALIICLELVRAFKEGQPAMDVPTIANKYQMPIKFVRKTMNSLVESGVVSEVVGEHKEESVYQPGVDIGKLNIQFILSAMDQSGTNDLPMETSEDVQSLFDSLTALTVQMNGLKENKLLAEL